MNAVGANKRNICFVTDGGAHLGFGHIQQSTTFAQELKADAQIRFVTTSDDRVVAKIVERGFSVTRLKDDAATFRYLQELDPAVVVFDKLDVSERLARDIKVMMRARLAIFTNLTAANRCADLAVTADIGSDFENVRSVDPETKTLFLYGPRYWVLRPEFYELWRKGKQVRSVVDRIVVLFGGSDPANLTAATVSQLLRGSRTLSVDVILGPHYHHDADLNQVLEERVHNRVQIRIRRDVANVAELMYAADLVLASPGLSAFEALRVGTPVIVIPHDALQRDTYQRTMRLLERPALCKLNQMIEDRDFTFSDDERISRMEIGEGVSELKRRILNLADGICQ